MKFNEQLGIEIDITSKMVRVRVSFFFCFCFDFDEWKSEYVCTLSTSCGLTTSSCALTLGNKADFKKLTNDAIFQFDDLQENNIFVNALNQLLGFFF